MINDVVLVGIRIISKIYAEKRLSEIYAENYAKSTITD